MDLFSKSGAKNLLKKYQISPSKRLGQNFLIDKGVLRKIIKVANLSKDDVVLEVGPGIGNLTLELAKRAKKVVTIEKDQNLIKILNNELRINGIKNVKIIRGDILKIPNSKFLIHNSYKVVANIPYYLTSPLIRKFLESKNRPKEMILVVQKEVAQRICAKVPKMNLLAISVQFYAQPEIISFISKKSFWPQPKVDSSIIKITPFLKNYTPDELFRKKFFQIVRAGFSQPRKQLLNNLSKILKLNKEKVKFWLLKNSIQPSQRAETLKISDWLKLTRSFSFQNFISLL